MTRPESRRDRLARYFASDLFVFEEPNRVYRTLKFIFITVLVGATAIAILSYVAPWRTTFVTAVVTGISFAVVIVVLRLGYPRVAGLLMLLALTIASTYSIFAGDGIHDVAIVLLPFVVVIGSFLLNTRFYTILSLLVLGAVVTIGSLEVSGRIEHKFSGLFDYFDVILLALLIAAEAVVIRLLASIITNSLSRAHRSERNYREVFNATSEAIFIHDAATGKILEVNDTSRDMFGYSRNELIGMSVSEISSKLPQYSDAESQRLIKMAEDEGMQVFEWLARHKNGEEFWVEVALQRTEIGGKGRILAAVRDVDARKRMEERLTQSEKMEAVGQLAGGIAHDFNNQLAGIVGYADLVRSELPDDDDIRDNLDRILTAARRASDLTTQLLAFARKGKYESIAVDTHQIVEEVVSLLYRSIDKRITIERRLNASPQLVTGDPTQLQAAILNLALNARDAMPDGGTLTFGTENHRLAEGDEDCKCDEIPPGDYIEISVTDTGIGMEPETQRHIFEPFFTTKGEGQGTGMGLAAVYGTIKNHGGCISVDSEPGRGSTFTVYLPAHRGPVGFEEPIQERPAAPKVAACVLIVDDEEYVCSVASKMLERWGYNTMVSYDGAAAVDLYRESWQKIDLVVLDMAMPKMGGRETFYALREINPDVAVLLTSGYSINKEVQELLEAGANGFVQKPFWKNEFSRVIAESLPRRTGDSVTEEQR